MPATLARRAMISGGRAGLSLLLLCALRSAVALSQELPTLTDADRDLLEAAGRGDGDGVRAALDEGARLDAVDEEYEGVFAHARGEAVLRALVDAGADPTFPGVTGVTWETPLQTAIRQDDAVKVEALLRLGADPSVRTGRGTTALMDAVGYGHEACVAALLGAPGLDVDAVDEDGNTALMLAADDGDEGLVELLLQAGASLAPRNRFGLSALGVALDDKFEEGTSCDEASRTCRLLLGAGADWRDFRARELGLELITAAVEGDLARCKSLLARGAATSVSSFPEGSPLTAAAERGDLALATLLLDAGADPFYPPRDVSALERAAQKGRIEVVRLLLDRGVTPDDPRFRYGPLVMVASTGHVDVAQLLIARGATVSGDVGRLAMMYAAMNQRAELVRLLLDAGAPLDEPSDHSGCIHYWSGGTPLAWAAYEGNLEIVRLLLSRGASPDGARTSMEDPPLVAAALRGHVGIVRELLRAGADPNVSGADGIPLEDAAKRVTPVAAATRRAGDARETARMTAGEFRSTDGGKTFFSGPFYSQDHGGADPEASLRDCEEIISLLRAAGARD